MQINKVEIRARARVSLYQNSKDLNHQKIYNHKSYYQLKIPSMQLHKIRSL